MSGKEIRKTSNITAGVNYENLDPFKKDAQAKGLETSKNLLRHGMREVSASRGESAYVWEEQDSYRAKVEEGLGTKNLVADAMRLITGKTYYDSIARDTVGTIVNDLIVVGASPLVISSHIAVGDSGWFVDNERQSDFIQGWKDACNDSGVVSGGGETAELRGQVIPGAIILGGSAEGIIKPKERLTLGDKLQAGDAIFLMESNGIHANGLTAARALAKKISDRDHITVPDAYATKLPDGRMYGEALLDPTILYPKVIEDFFNAGIDIHYMVNITGHGWRKLMRAQKEFTYVIGSVPDPQPVFGFIQEHLQMGKKEMYEVFNMGAGFAVFMPEGHVKRAQEIAFKNHRIQSGQAGVVENGSKRVYIEPLQLDLDALNIR